MDRRDTTPPFSVFIAGGAGKLTLCLLSSFYGAEFGYIKIRRNGVRREREWVGKGREEEGEHRTTL